jgi:hypothetical protein
LGGHLVVQLLPIAMLVLVAASMALLRYSV